MRSELTHAIRSVVRTPVFALTAIVILALGIGATTAMFALVNCVILHEGIVRRPAQATKAA